MSHAGRVSLGREWKQKILANRQGAKFVIPKGVTLDHPYIKEAEEGEISKPAAAHPVQGKVKK